MNDLKQMPVWLCWRYEERDGRQTKVPYSALTGKQTGTSQDHAGEWATFERVGAARGYDGVGFVLPELPGGCAVFAVDIDHRDLADPMTIAALDLFPGGYMEHSPSGEGVHVIGIVELAKLPAACFDTYYMKNPGNGMEIYIAGMTNRYMTYTGNVIMGGILQDLTAGVLAFLEQFMRRPAARPKAQQPVPAAGALPDEQLLQKARSAKNGAKFAALYDRGDTTGYQSRSEADIALCGMLAYWTGGDPQRVEALWRASALWREKAASRPDYAAATIKRAVESCSAFYDPAHRDTLPLQPADYTDVGESLMLAREYGDRLRYCPGLSYLVYDGKVWNENEIEAQGLQQELTERQLKEAAQAVRMAYDTLAKAETEQGDPGAQEKAKRDLAAAKAYHAFILKCRGSARVDGVLRQTRSMVPVAIADLDADYFKLNTPGGTVDLASGTIRPHDPADYCTKMTKVAPSNDNKGYYLWLDALRKFTCEDEELEEYLQLAAGAFAIGHVYNEMMIIAYGDGRNGKSTLFNVLARVLGGYAGGLSAEVLTTCYKGNKKPEYAALRGLRYVIAAELEEGTRLDTSTVKKLTSTDPIHAEKKFEAPFDFIPSHTVVLYTNHLPKVGTIDEGTWRRIVPIPFNAVIEGDADIKNYADYLFDNAGGAILHWVIMGAKKLIAQRFKIEKPEIVKAAFAEYRGASDWLADYVGECCEEGGGYSVGSGKLYEDYRAYCGRMGEYARGTTDFYAALNGAGYARRKTKTGAFVYGLRLRDTEGAASWNR